MKFGHFLSFAAGIQAANCALIHQKRAACAGNTASDRTSWCDYDINSDYTTIAPDTGVTREYWFELNDVTIAPDGYPRTAMAVNGTIPGPTIFADWGDNVVVHVKNNLTVSQNGTSIHFHGIRQNYTNNMDGVVSITQCPTAPGESTTYQWKATQYGSSWYHSHFGLQAWQGIFGGIVINGPASANYDEDKGLVFLNDWSHKTCDQLYASAQASGPPTLDNGLINGTNVYGSDGAANQTGYRFNTTFTEGQSYRLRLVNGAIDTHFKFSIDNHTMKVIANDLVPIQPFETTVLNIGIGQRYDIIVSADQASVADSFWMRAIPQSACSDNDSTNNIKGIIYYGNSSTTPTTTGYSYTDSCDDEDPSNLVPVISKIVSSGYVYNVSEPVTIGMNDENLFRWKMNGTSMKVEWDDPTLLQVWNNETSFTNTSGVLELPEANKWAHILVETSQPVPHPLHLHGHDFYVLDQGTGTYNASNITLANPPRRDTAMLPASGYLLLAFQTDNPGAWLMHCHIGWHTEEGFALQILEQYSAAREIIDYDILEGNCKTWDSYYNTNSLKEDDSGI
ncbi:hypothetical protein Plec18167_005191 [Paecilomyces lecythidis]|uniref:Laccase n=1 Tax=Paecilomyces lecythidis TaxID=3004212 RepID=A0ABR3XLD2_9EURO